MICFQCDNETDFEVQEIEIEQLFHGETIKVLSPVTICKCCGFQSLDIGQTNELLKRVRDYSNWEHGDLYNADPSCRHFVIGASGGGVKCVECNGWFCY
jgi:hypothetical protein